MKRGQKRLLCLFENYKNVFFFILLIFFINEKL